MTSTFGLRLLLAGVVATTACSLADLFESPTHEVASLIIFYGDTSRLSAPDTVAPGAAFEVAFQTFGGGCTRTAARTDIDISQNIVRIAPFDRSSGDGTCPSDLLLLRHSVQVRLDVPGQASLRVVGEQRGGSTGSTNGPAELTRHVVVR